MKRFLFLVSAGTALINAVNAQAPLPAAYNSNSKINYIRTWNAVAPISHADTMLARPTKDVRQVTQYYDGLGRPLQTVAKGGSMVTGTSAKDMVIPIVYDEFSRERYKYLSFAANTMGSNTSISDGKFKLNPFQQDSAFNKGLFSDETYFYSQTNFEASPLNRIQESFAPGNSWVGTAGESSESNRHSVKATYLFNTAIDSIRIWNITDVTNDFGTYATASGSTGIYPAGELYKNITIDEHGKQVIEFKDKTGLVLLKKVQHTAVADTGTGKGHTGWLCTYYLYDYLNRLRCVIQPRGVELISSNWVLTNVTILYEQCFRYEYDNRNRMILKKVPAAEEQYLVYDTKDRLVMIKNYFMCANAKWMVTLYDSLNRPVQTGFLLDTWVTRTVQQHQDSASLSSAYPFTASNTPSNTYWELLTKTGYDNYDSLPVITGVTATVDTVYTSATYMNTSYNTAPLYAQNPVRSLQLKGMTTWTQTKILNSSPVTYLYSVNIYDDKGRLIQTKAKNITGGIDINTTQYNWAGQPLIMVQKQEKAATPAQTTVTVTRMSYDDLGRVVTTEKRLKNTLVSSNALSVYDTISTIEYDALGQVKKKKIGSKKDPSTGNYYTTRQPLQEMVYDYNILGWMLGMNRDYLETEGQTSDGKYFGYELGYDKVTNKAGHNFTGNGEFNGNIGGMMWKSNGDDTRRQYDFRYDAVNRLLKAEFVQHNPEDGNWNSDKVNYTVKMGDGSTSTTAYDANGNIKRMQQWGLKLTGSSQIDDLTYNYMYSGYSNKLLNVIDAVNDTLTTLGDFITKGTHPTQSKTSTTTDYLYDGDGNLLKDLNKGIGKSLSHGIVNNHRNQPRVVTLYGHNEVLKGSIIYVYDANGNKLKKTVSESASAVNNNITTTTITTYLGGFVYETKTDNNAQTTDYTDRLQYIAHEEGRIRFKKEDSTLHYDYMIKDHLGNVRMMLTEENKKDMYPSVTFENGTTVNEQLYYENATLARSARPGDFYTSITNGDTVQLLRKSTQSIGAGKLLKVMATDKLHVKVDYYIPNDATDNANADGLNSVLTSLLSVLNGSAPAPVHGNGGTLTDNLENSTPFTDFLAPQVGNNGTMPKAYLNILFFDEQFKFVSTNSEVIQVTTKGSGQQIVKIDGDAKEAIKNGYAYIYVSNESNNMVYFDNLQVTHERGSITDETGYYPFGLPMLGISSKALSFGKPDNKKKYQGYEYNTDFDINLYETFYRSHDPQIGRFLQIDPKPSDEVSLYAAMNNNPIRYSDLLGDTLTFPGASDEFKQQFNEATALLEAKGVGGLYNEAKSKIKGTIKVVQLDEGVSNYDPETKTLNWNPYQGAEVGDGVIISPTTVLNHEFDHGVAHIKDPKGFDKRTDPKTGKDAQYGDKEEKRVITGSEQKTATALGEVKKGKVTRTNHSGNIYPTAGPTTTKSAAEALLEKMQQQRKAIQEQKKKQQNN